MARLRTVVSARWLLILAVFAFLTASYWQQARTVRNTDQVMELGARAGLFHVIVTATNRSAGAVTLDLCTFHTHLSGGVMEPMYKPCERRPVLLGPGESVTDRIPVVKWLWGESVKANLRYEADGRPATLAVPLPRTWLFWVLRW